MKGNTVITIVIIFAFIACKRDKFETRPQIKLKSINSTVIAVGESLVVQLEYTDKQGDLGQDTLMSIRRRLNRRPPPGGAISVDTLHNMIPEFPNKPKGEFEVKFEYKNLHQSDIENDTILFKFIAKDRGGHVSDTVTTPTIVVLRR